MSVQGVVKSMRLILPGVAAGIMVANTAWLHSLASMLLILPRVAAGTMVANTAWLHGLASMKASDYIEIARLVLEAIGGLWVLHLYLAKRQGQGSLSITHGFRIYRPDPSSGGAYLIVSLVIQNTREVLLRDLSGRVTLLDASQRDPAAGEMVLAAFGERDPFVQFINPADPEFEPVGLEPGDLVDTEMAFALERVGLMAVRISIEGKQGETDKTVFLWNSFFYVDPPPVAKTPRWR